MPRGRKTKVTEPEAEGSPSLVKELLEVMETERTRQMEEQREREERRTEEHKELMRVLAGLMKKRVKRKLMEEREDYSSSDETESEPGEDKAVRGIGEPVLMKFSEKDTDIEHFLMGFERVATAYRWSDELWVVKLAPLLTGRALASYANMDQEEAKSYKNVKKAILRRFDINEETYRQRFRSTRKTGPQSYVELGVQLKDLFRKWTV